MSDGVPSDGRPLDTASGPCEQVLLDLRRPRLLDDREQLLKVKAGHADIFVVGNDNRRRHLFRVEADDIVLDLHTPCANSGLQIIAIGGPGAELISLPRTQLVSVDALARWISHLARLVIPPAIAGTMLELVTGEAFEMQAGHARRGPMRSIAWTRVAAGSAKLLGLDPALNPGDQPLPLVGGLWIQAGESGCRVLADAAMPEASVLWPAVDKIHLAIVSILAMGLAQAAALERQRLSQRIELTQSQTLDSLERLAEMVVGKSVLGEGELHQADPLIASCRTVVASLGAQIPVSTRSGPGHTFRDILEIGRTARLRLRRVQLREGWWKLDVGPLAAWRGEERSPVALIRNHAGYTMIDPAQKGRHAIDRSLAADIAPDAVAFYPALPSRSLRYLDLLAVAMKGLSGGLVRTFILVLLIGLLSLIPPLITNFLVNSVIPRTEIDQLIVCALALVVSAVSISGLQVVQSMVMLRLEGLIDYKLQAAVIDRLLRLPTALFRNYTTGDLVDRSMGIDAVRKILTGRVLRGFTSALFCVFSVSLMFYYDLRLGAISLLLTLVRAAIIVGTSVVRV